MMRDSAPRSRTRRALRLALWLALALGLASGAEAQNAVQFSPDITADLGTVGSSVVGDEDVAEDDAAGTVSLVPLGAIPANAAVHAYEFMPSGDRLLSFDTTISLPGLPAGMPAEPRDVVLFDPTTLLFSPFFDGSAAGVPVGARVDAVTLNELDELILSFDITVALPGLGPVDDEDLVKFAGGVFSMEFDGSANAIAPELDLDAADKVRGTDDMLLSFDISGKAPAVLFDDEDVLAFDTAALTYSMHFDASVSDPTDWPPTDLIALPEPGFGVSVVAGLALLAVLVRLRDSG